MKKVLDCTDCNSVAEVAEKIEKDLLANMPRFNTKKNSKKKHNQKQTTSTDEAKSEKEEKPVKLSVWKRIKNWFKRL
jgi:cell division ATPase FtsA